LFHPDWDKTLEPLTCSLESLERFDGWPPGFLESLFHILELEQEEPCQDVIADPGGSSLRWTKPKMILYDKTQTVAELLPASCQKPSTAAPPPKILRTKPRYSTMGSLPVIPSRILNGELFESFLELLEQTFSESGMPPREFHRMTERMFCTDWHATLEPLICSVESLENFDGWPEGFLNLLFDILAAEETMHEVSKM
jgi:hypothetical protein